MKKIKFIIYILGVLGLFSCNEEKWLKETPLDFYTPENSYETPAQFQKSLNYIYDLIRWWNFRYNDESSGFQHHLYIGSDMYYHGHPNTLEDNLNNYGAWIIPVRDHVNRNWSTFYNGVSAANVILTKLETNASQVQENDKKRFKGEALFFRAYYFSRLAHIWGDVPLITEMITEPKNDFTRDPRDKVYEQCQADLENAIMLLDNIDLVADGAVNKQVAQHLLSEVYICRGNYSKAIEVANAVINYPKVGLMTERFGSYKDDPTKDVFFDLFREGNTNRKSGNTEGLYVIQYDWQNGSPYLCNRSRYLMPQLRTAVTLKVGGTDINNPADRTAAIPDFTMENGGRGNGYFPTTYYFRQIIWQSDFDNDIRNSSCNIFRDYIIDNVGTKNAAGQWTVEPAAGHGQWLIKDGWLYEPDTFSYVYPQVTKLCAFEGLPNEAYETSGGVKQITALGNHKVINSNDYAVGSFKDEYLIRLAETYLLLAEAYVLNNQPQQAADAINVVRSRAKASPATAEQMNIDYILDERARELAGEEVRNITLFRMGKMVERARKYGPAGNKVLDHQNLYPIPYAEIEKNIGAVLTQNPGY